MQTASSKIWNCFTDFISYGDNRYHKRASIFCILMNFDLIKRFVLKSKCQEESKNLLSILNKIDFKKWSTIYFLPYKSWCIREVPLTSSLTCWIVTLYLTIPKSSYVYLRPNNFAKVWTRYHNSYGLNSTIAILLQGWHWHYLFHESLYAIQLRNIAIMLHSLKSIRSRKVVKGAFKNVMVGFIIPP